MNCTTTSFHSQTERNWFIEQLQQLAIRRRIRVSFVSGDVHCAAVGVLKTLTKKKSADVSPAEDHRYMVNIVSSTYSSMFVVKMGVPTEVAWFCGRIGAIVNTPYAYIHLDYRHGIYY